MSSDERASPRKTRSPRAPRRPRSRWARPLTPTDDGPLIAATAGVCFGSRGPGGWAWATANDEFCDRSAHDTTHQRMELVALRELLQTTPVLETLQIHTDSAYVLGLFRDDSYKPRQNLELVDGVREALRLRVVEFTEVGDGGRELHEWVKELARAAAERARSTPKT